MLKAIVNFLNLKLELLNYFDLTRCLCELKRKGDVVAPKEYVSAGEWQNIDFDSSDGVSYWRLRDPISVTRETNPNKALKRVQTTVPMKLVFSVRRDKLTTDDAYSFDRIRQTIVKQFNIDNGALTTALGAAKVTITAPSSDGDPLSVWEDETGGTGKQEPDFKYVFGSIDIDIVIDSDTDCLATECDDVDSDILHTFDFCDAAVRDRLTPEQVTCLEDALCGVCADATVQLNGTTVGTVASGATGDFPVNLDGSPSGSWDGTAWQVTSPPCDDSTIELNGVEMTTIPSGDTENILVLQSNDMTQVGSKQGTHWRIDDSAISINGSPVADVKAEDPLDIDVTQDGSPVGSWNGSAWIVPPCSAPSISITYSNNTPTYGDTITITATPTGITPTSYTFIISGNIHETITVQAGNTFSWVVNTLNPTIYVQATDGSSFAASVDSSLTVSSITEAGNFITALETLTSDTMGGRAKDAVNRLRWMLGGNNTTNSTDLWALLTATNAVLYIYCPNDDSTAYFDGYKIDLLNPTHTGTFINMVAGDISVEGVKGGSGKALNMDVQPADFDLNSIMLHTYQSKYGLEYLTVPMGVHETNNNTVGVSAFWQFNQTQAIVRANTSGSSFLNKQSTSGILSFGRNSSTQVKVATNGSIDATGSTASVSAIAEDIYGHGYQNASTGASTNTSSNTYAGFAVTPFLTDDEYLDFCEAWDDFNKIVITNGRKCNI